MNQVSIIINGVRYDAVSILPNPTFCSICSQCHFNEVCEREYLALSEFCNEFLEKEQVFKKSDKKFEK